MSNSRDKKIKLFIFVFTLDLITKHQDTRSKQITIPKNK